MAIKLGALKLFGFGGGKTAKPQTVPARPAAASRGGFMSRPLPLLGRLRIGKQLQILITALIAFLLVDAAVVAIDAREGNFGTVYIATVGKIRMLSQRLVKLHGLQLSGVAPVKCAQQFQESVQRIDAHLAQLDKSLSHPTYGDLLGQVVQTWAWLKSALGAAAPLPVVDDGAEQLLQGAERLTASLESAGVTAPLRVLNMAGRQRMLSQRFAKYAVLQVLAQHRDASLAARCATGMAQAQADFEQALTDLNALPLSTAEIDSALEAAGTGWLQMLAACRATCTVAGRDASSQLKAQDGLVALAASSEDLLTVFERLSTHYERSMQVLTGS